LALRSATIFCALSTSCGEIFDDEYRAALVGYASSADGCVMKTDEKHNAFAFHETPDTILGSTEDMYTEDALPRDWVNFPIPQLTGYSWCDEANSKWHIQSTKDGFVRNKPHLRLQTNGHVTIRHKEAGSGWFFYGAIRNGVFRPLGYIEAPRW